MEDIKRLNLTEKDFQLLMEGLENLPHKHVGAELLTDLLIGAVAKTDEDRQAFAKKQEIVQQKKIAERQLLKEDVAVLLGKLIQLKRYLIENNLMDQVTEYLK